MKHRLSCFPFHRLGLHYHHLSLRAKEADIRGSPADRKYS